MGDVAQVGYVAGDDLAQGNRLSSNDFLHGVGNDNDGSLSGELLLFSPS